MNWWCFDCMRCVGRSHIKQVYDSGGATGTCLSAAEVQTKPETRIEKGKRIMREHRDERQRAIGYWSEVNFGRAEGSSIPQRGIRHLEEAAEAAHAAGVPLDMAIAMIRYVWSRPKGELAQELGGSAITLLAFAQAAGLSADECEQKELERVLSKPVGHFAQRNAEKNAAGFTLVPREVQA